MQSFLLSLATLTLAAVALLPTSAAQLTQPRNIEAIKGDQPAIVQAAADGNTHKVSELLESGTKVNTVGLQGFTALHMAAHNGFLDIARILIKAGADVNMQKSPRRKGFENTAGWSPLHWAAKGNHASSIRLLAQAGAKLDIEANVAMRFGTPLHVAAGDDTRSEAVKALLLAGADVDGLDIDGNTALHFAASRNATSASRMLLRFGADAKAANNQKQTPLSFAMAQRPLAGSAAATKAAPIVKKPKDEPITVVVEGEGSLGVALVQYGDNKPPEIEAITPGGALSKFQGLRAGLILSNVQGTAVTDHDHAIGLIKASQRPLTLTFTLSEADRAHEAAAAAAAAREESILLERKYDETVREGMTPLQVCMVSERKTAFGQWLRARHLEQYARAFLMAGYISTADVLKSDVFDHRGKKLKKLGVKSKKHRKKIMALKKQQKQEL